MQRRIYAAIGREKPAPALLKRHTARQASFRRTNSLAIFPGKVIIEWDCQDRRERLRSGSN
ncbi:MAG: hypothetical protein WB819_11310 [Terriglobia bacterium]